TFPSMLHHRPTPIDCRPTSACSFSTLCQRTSSCRTMAYSPCERPRHVWLVSTAQRAARQALLTRSIPRLLNPNHANCCDAETATKASTGTRGKGQAATWDTPNLKGIIQDAPAP